MRRRLVNGLTPGRINRLLGVVLAFFLAVAGILYWQGYIQAIELLLAGIIALVAGIAYVFGIRVAQKDGFLDGYTRAKDDFNRKKQ